MLDRNRPVESEGKYIFFVTEIGDLQRNPTQEEPGGKGLLGRTPEICERNGKLEPKTGNNRLP